MYERREQEDGWVRQRVCYRYYGTADLLILMLAQEATIPLVVRTTNTAKTMIDTSLCDLIRNFVDFIDEETLLQTKSRKMDNNPNHITVDQTPKCHPELAGEGIEYYWGCAKNFYRRLPLYENKGKDNFCRSAKKVTATENITTARIWMFSRRAQEYIVAYKLFRREQNADGVNMNLHTNVPVNKIEQMVKCYKTHRCALYFDLGFLNLVVKNKDAT